MAARFGQNIEPIQTDIHVRLDRLPWGRFHWLVVAALGITWILDGLEVTLTGAVSPAIQASPVLQMSESQIGAAASAYLFGAVLGAGFFGRLADAAGRKRLFFVTLAVYLLATAATALSQNFYQFVLFRFLTGAGIGGEYVAINSAIQELVPARYRGRTDLAINGSFWVGAALGSFGAAVLLEPGRLPPDMGWRFAFGIGAVLGAGILFLRSWLPESPRWLMIRGRIKEADEVVTAIEKRMRVPGGPVTDTTLKLVLRIHERTAIRDLFFVLVKRYPKRTLLGLILMAAQAFFYNALFFTYALVLHKFFDVSSADVGLFILPFTITNFIGPLALGWLFDRWGRRPMITLTYAVSGCLLITTAVLFAVGMLNALTITLAFALTFFFASPAASSAYLTVSESFPLEIRALCIAVFYSFGTLIGGVPAPWLFGTLVGTGSVESVAAGYAAGAGIMVAAAVVAAILAVPSERRALEDVAKPLSSAE